MSFMEAKSPLKNAPSCWNDDKRMTALYAPFRAREINPVDYDSKMKFWQNLISDWCLEKNHGVFTIKEIQEEFRRKERVPLGLNTVVDNLERSGEVKLKEDFLKIDPHESWTGWAVKSLIKTPVLWSFSKLKMALMEIDESTIEYICISFLKKKCESLIVKTGQKLYDQSEIRTMLTSPDGVEISDECFEILLRWMLINKMIQMKKFENDVLVKFNHGLNAPISDVEISIHVLEKNKITFEKAIQALEEEKEEFIITAKSYLKKGMRDTAKTYLRRKKEVEKAIAKRVSALENIDVLLSRIQDTSSDAKVFDTYKIALNALKVSFKEHGLSEEEVTNTVTEIQEINEMHEEIQNALAEPLTTVYDMELDDELKAILESDKNKDIILPEVPTHNPEVIRSSEKTFLEPAS